MSFLGNLFANNPYKSLAPSDSDSDDDSIPPAPCHDTEPLHDLPALIALKSPSKPKPLCAIFTTASCTDIDLLPAADKFYGDTYHLLKPDNIFRVSMKNVNSVSINKVDAQVSLLCEDQQRMEIDLLGIVEHKLDMTKYHVRKAFDAAARKVCHPVRVELGSSEYQALTDYKPGGTAIIAQGDITGCIQIHGSDKYGRWSYVTTTGTQGSINIFITAYQVCKKPTNKVGITAYHQQRIAFLKEKRPNLDPRHNFRKDLIAFITRHQTRGHNIILTGNFNEHVQDHNSFLQQVCMQCHMIDIWK
jgi:hypothetical protein